MIPLALGILPGAGCVYLLSVKLDTPGRPLVDPATAQTVLLKSRHTLFWIPLRWIALIVRVFGFLVLLSSASSSGRRQTKNDRPYVTPSSFTLG